MGVGWNSQYTFDGEFPIQKATIFPEVSTIEGKNFSMWIFSCINNVTLLSL